LQGILLILYASCTIMLVTHWAVIFSVFAVAMLLCFAVIWLCQNEDTQGQCSYCCGRCVVFVWVRACFMFLSI